MYLWQVYPILPFYATFYFIVVTCSCNAVVNFSQIYHHTHTILKRIFPCVLHIFVSCRRCQRVPLHIVFWNLLVNPTFFLLFLWHFNCLLCSICAIITIVWKELPTSSHLHQTNVEIEEAIVMLTLKAEKRNPDEKAKKFWKNPCISLWEVLIWL